MPRREYQSSLADLQSDVEAMGGLVLDQLADSLQALETHDESLAREVVRGDEAVNRRYLDIESDCIDLFALQQPVASDLRFVAGSFKIITDLERIGDLAANFGRYTLVARREEAIDVDLETIGDRSRALVADALDAYGTGDEEACRRIVARDDEIDALCQTASQRLVRDLIEHGTTDDGRWAVEQSLDDVTRVLLSIRDLERVADHGANVAARTLYVIEGETELIY